MLIGRTGLDVDVKRAGDVLGFDKDKRLTLRDLEPGSFYAFGPAISKQVIEVRSGKVTTTHPEPGKIAPPAPPPPAAVKKLVAQLQDLAAQAKQETLTIEEKDQEIIRLKREISGLRRNAPESVVDDKAIARAVATAEKPLRDEVAQLERQRNAAVTQWRRNLKQYNEELGKHFGRMQVLSSQLLALSEKPPVRLEADATIDAAAHINKIFSDARAAVVPAEKRTPAARVNTKVNAIDGITDAQARILAAVATMESIGVSTPSRPSVGALSNYSNTSGGTFASNVSRLVEAGLLAIPAPGLVELTDQGRSVAPASEPIDTLDDLHQKWLAVLSDAEARILAALIEAYPEALTRPKLGEITNYSNTSGGTFASNVAKLCEMRAAVIPAKGLVQASSILFPKGLK